MKAKTMIASVFLLAFAVGAVAPKTAEGAWCTISQTEKQILGGKQKVGTEYGVPNYAQSNFPGDKDCAPTAAAMLMGYHQLNGWDCLIDGTDDDRALFRDIYCSDAEKNAGNAKCPSEGLRDLVVDLQDQLPWTSSMGTVAIDSFIPFLNGYFGSDVVTVAKKKDSQASKWTYDDDDLVSQSDIKSNMNQDRPMVINVSIPDIIDAIDGWNSTWDGSSTSGGKELVKFHFLTILGYKERVLGYDSWFGCIDWMVHDDFYIIMRSGWKQGGDSTLWYHWTGLDSSDMYTVEIDTHGTSTCSTTASCEGICGGYNAAGSCYCDDVCEGYGDCCYDYSDQCEPTCEEKCVELLPGWAAWCPYLCDVIPEYFE